LAGPGTGRHLAAEKRGGISGCLPGLSVPLIVDRGHHAQRGVLPPGVAVIDPGADPGPESASADRPPTTRSVGWTRGPDGHNRMRRSRPAAAPSFRAMHAVLISCPPWLGTARGAPDPAPLDPMKGSIRQCNDRFDVAVADSGHYARLQPSASFRRKRGTVRGTCRRITPAQWVSSVR
jgi:hypothetical protein